ncbi:zinc ribbon domain-containing protein [Telmatobacter sp. DSM 110680]|uniref:Zinc ribbon domain-containing protein n=1 Tax=Telmatobacter sp. DSM 110680 TaxID=3036704 RepID=A0AAU7DRT7_9BACT
MYCSKCGAENSQGTSFCSRCGHPTASLLDTQPAEAAELNKYQLTIRRLSRYWYLFAGLNLVLGAMGLFAVQTGISMHVGPWEPWPHPYLWDWVLVGGMGWTLLTLRVAFAVASGWGLSRLTDWSRVVTLVAAGFAFLDFPIGFALAIYTFCVLHGKHHGHLFSRLGVNRMAIGIR